MGPGAPERLRGATGKGMARAGGAGGKVKTHAIDARPFQLTCRYGRAESCRC
jgi:hypothetical protein